MKNSSLSNILQLKKSSHYNGRARRKEFWMFFLCNFIIGFIIGILGLDVISYIYSLAVLVPGIAVSVRRLHDIDKSGWWYLINLIPLIGNIWFIVLAAQDSKPGVNAYGPNPKGL